MIHYKVDIFEKLAEKGYTTYRLRKEKILSESSMQKIREEGNITLKTLNIICLILNCQPSDVIEVISTDQESFWTCFYFQFRQYRNADISNFCNVVIKTREIIPIRIWFPCYFALFYRLSFLLLIPRYSTSSLKEAPSCLL